MSLDDLGNIGEFVAAVAVVLSLIYLAVQIRQNTGQINVNTSALQRADFDQATQSFSRYRDPMIRDRALAELYVTGLRDIDALDGPDRLDAYECVMQVAAYYRGSPSASEHARLRDGLERAAKSDPGYSDAFAWLARIYLDEDLFNYNPRPNPLDRAMDAAQRAVTLDPTSQIAHHVLAAAHFHRQELDAFFADAERAIALNPNHAATLAGLGMRFHQAGDERGIALVRKAMKLDPFLPTIFNIPIAAYHLERGAFEEALVAARKVNIPGFFPTQMFLAMIYTALGRPTDARAAVEELLRLRPGYTTETFVEESRKINAPDDRIRRFSAALRKAGLPE